MSFLKRLFGGRENIQRREAHQPEKAAAESSDWSNLGTAPLNATSATTRPLPSLDTYLKRPGRLQSGQATDVGLKRDNNEDALYVMSGVVDSVERQPPLGVFIVADGMGGYAAGELASALAIKVVARHLARSVYLPLLEDPPARDEDKPIPELLEEALEEANRVVLEHPSGGATTMTVAVILGSSLYVCHAGDCRAYLIQEGKIQRLTRDHSLVERLVEIGQLSLEEARVHPDRNKVYKALGREAVLEPQRFTHRLQPGMKILLCTDGLWGEVDDATLLQISESTPDLQEACDRLVAQANQAGGRDNVSVVLVQIPSGGQGSS